MAIYFLHRWLVVGCVNLLYLYLSFIPFGLFFPFGSFSILPNFQINNLWFPSCHNQKWLVSKAGKIQRRKELSVLVLKVVGSQTVWNLLLKCSHIRTKWVNGLFLVAIQFKTVGAIDLWTRRVTEPPTKPITKASVRFYFHRNIIASLKLFRSSQEATPRKRFWLFALRWILQDLISRLCRESY